MGVGQLSESDAVDDLRLPFYSSSHPTGSHGWRNQFDLGNPDLVAGGLDGVALPDDDDDLFRQKPSANDAPIPPGHCRVNGEVMTLEAARDRYPHMRGTWITERVGATNGHVEHASYC